MEDRCEWSGLKQYGLEVNRQCLTYIRYISTKRSVYTYRCRYNCISMNSLNGYISISISICLPVIFVMPLHDDYFPHFIGMGLKQINES